MAKQLVELELFEVSCVDEPANAGARVLMFKHLDGLPPKDGVGGGGEGDGSGNGAGADPTNKEKDTNMNDKPMTQEAVQKMVSDAVAEAVAKVRADAKVATDAAAAEVAKANAAAAAASAAAEAATKRASDAEQAAAVEKTARELATFEKRADAEFGLLPGSGADKALALKSVAGLPEAVAKTVMEMLAAGQAAMKAQATEAGRAGGGGAGGGAEAALKAKTDAIQKADPKLTYAEAYDKALGENPDLYKQYVAERRAGISAAA